MIELIDLPMPPSSNRLNRRRGGPGMCRSPEYEAFLREVEDWRLAHLRQAQEARARLQSWLREDPRARAHVQARFFFERRAILCKDGRPKRNDTENRLKALLDSVASLLGCDDCLFWSGSFDKEPLGPGLVYPSVEVRISLIAEPTRPAAVGLAPASDHRNLTVAAAAA